jgi:TRAP-type C4-dicarboxylate transport system substrate-binding protein
MYSRFFGDKWLREQGNQIHKLKRGGHHMISNKKTKISLSLVFLGFFIAITLMTGIHPTPAVAKTTNLKFAYWMPTKHTLHRVFVKFKNEVELLTKGEVKITLYPGGALGKPPQHISFFIPAYTAGRFPRSTVFDLPLLGGGSALLNTALAQGVFEKHIAPDFKDAKMLIFFNSEPLTIHTSKKKITSMADVSGLKIRSAGAIQSAMVKRLGGSPVTMPITEVYTSLEKGVIDGVLTAYTAMVSFRLYDVSKYSIMNGLTSIPMAVAMNRKTWNSLSPEVQKILDGLRMRYSLECATEYDVDYLKAVARGKSLGKDIYPLSAAELAKWEKQFAPIYGDWVADMKSKGIPGDEILKAVRQLKGK